MTIAQQREASVVAQTSEKLTALLHEYHSRWTELLAIQAEVSTWLTLYLSALFVVVGWMATGDADSRLSKFLTSRRSVDGFMLISMALLNTSFLLAMLVKSYNIHEIASYLHSVTGASIAELTGVRFSRWEEWRRVMPFGFGRRLYYMLTLTVPVAVSVALLSSYFVRFPKPTGREWTHFSYALVVAATTLGTFAYGLAIAVGIGRFWQNVILP